MRFVRLALVISRSSADILFAVGRASSCPECLVFVVFVPVVTVFPLCFWSAFGLVVDRPAYTGGFMP